MIDDLYIAVSSDESYQDVLVKELYETYPEISYPAITIEEIENEDDSRFFDETERVSKLSYQIAIYCSQSETKSAIENVRAIGKIIDNYLKGDKYRCLKRIGSFPITPMINDDNIKIGYLRYNCNLDITNHIIYRRY